MSKISIEELYKLFIGAKSVTKDTRDIPQGSIFFSLKGERFNGNQFAKEALEKGAAYAIIDEEKYQSDERLLLVDDCLVTLQELAKYHRAQLNIPVLGITGSNGKTTTKELIGAVLSKKFNIQLTRGNYNNHIGVPLTVLSIRKEHELAIVEMGANHQGEIDFLCSIGQPTHGLITNIGKAHLEGFGGIEGVKKGKSELYKYLSKTRGVAFLNKDDSILLSLCNVNNRFTYGQGEYSNVKGYLSEEYPFLKGKWKAEKTEGTFDSKLYGVYNFNNILAAIAIGTYFEIPSDKISLGIHQYEADMNRSQLIEKNSYKVYLDAYNANPDSMELSIKNFEANRGESKIVVLGDMFELGEDAKQEHRKIIQLVSSLKDIDTGVFVGKLFHEQKIEHPNLLFFPTVTEAKDWFTRFPKKEKAFLLKGSRGMAMENILK